MEIRMSEAIRSPKDIKYVMLGYMNKFVKAKFKFVYAIYYVQNEKMFNSSNSYLDCSLVLNNNISDSPIIVLKINYDNTVTAIFDYRGEGVLLSSSTRILVDNALNDVKYVYGDEYDSKYDDIILYFSDLGNTKACGDYILQIHELLYSTPYIFVLPKAYTFLLCNSHSRKFPKEIAKLIAHKILFASDASHPRCP